MSNRIVLVVAVLGFSVLDATVAGAQRATDSALARADAAFADGDRTTAERGYEDVLRRDSSQSRAVFRLAQLREKRDAASSIALYRRYVVLQPRDAWGHMALGNALGATGDLSAALSAYDEAARVAPAERDVHVGRARLLARAGHTDESIAAYERWVSTTPGDAESWRELAAQRKKAGRYPEAVVALERVRALETKPAESKIVERDIGRARALGRSSLEPLVGGSSDSDGLTTGRAGATFTSAALGRARAIASVSAGRAGDGTVARVSQQASVGAQFRPLAQLRLELAGGIARADRAFVDTIIVLRPGTGQGPGGRRPIGVPTVVGSSSFETLPVGRARLAWRQPGDAIAVDVRAGRQLLDASPFLIAQGVVRDEASLSLDVRLAGPIRARGFAKAGAVHNADETNGRQIFGGALAYAPGSYEVSMRAQTMQYDAATRLAYFAPRYVRTAELTTYIERETEGGTTIAIDLGAGAQQVADWTTAPSTWSPSLRGWTQVVMPLTSSLSFATEVEAYHSKVGTDTPSLSLTASQWQFASLSLSLRAAF
jgi:tetratricopeptide (TPR) repeat protein